MKIVLYFDLVWLLYLIVFEPQLTGQRSARAVGFRAHQNGNWEYDW